MREILPVRAATQLFVRQNDDVSIMYSHRLTIDVLPQHVLASVGWVTAASAAAGWSGDILTAGSSATCADVAGGSRVARSLLVVIWLCGGGRECRVNEFCLYAGEICTFFFMGI